MSKRLNTYIHARKTAANRDVVSAGNDNRGIVVDKEHDKYRIQVKKIYPKSMPITHYPKSKIIDSEKSEELIDEEVHEDGLLDNMLRDSDDGVAIDYITDRNNTEENSMSDTMMDTIDTLNSVDTLGNVVRSEINSFLTGLENRYTDQTPFKMWNRMYTIGLDIAVSSYSNNMVRKIIDRAINESVNELGTEMLEEVRVYNKKKVVEYIQAGIEDGLSSDYSDIYFKVMSGKTLIDVNNHTEISTHLGTMFSKYVDSAHPLDLEQFYNVGILIANRPFDRERMVQKLKKLIEERSKDEVIAIQRNKRAQLMERMNRGFQDSITDKIRNAYDLNGNYNYKGKHRELLRKRARIDGLLNRNKKS